MTALPETVDVVVLGAGMAGHVAALAAAEAGASVLLLEKGPSYGGTSALSGGGMVFAGTDLQAAAGVEDDAEALRDEIWRVGRRRSDPEIVDVYVRHQLETYEWLRDRGLEFFYDPAPHVRRVHAVTPGPALDLLHGQVDEHPSITYRAETRAERLVRAESGAVAGVVVHDHSGRPTVGAARGVVLTTGGFARDDELLTTFAPQWLGAARMGGEHNTGDGLRMAMALGAGLVDMAEIEASFGASIRHYPDLSPHPETTERLLFPNLAGAIMVNLEARRFTDESVNYKILASLCAAQTKGVAIQVFDRTVLDRGLANEGPLDLAHALAEGDLMQADSLAELARDVGLDPEDLETAVRTYNTSIDASVDEFGRGDDRTPLTRAPFYAYPSRPALTTTYCGVAVDRTLTVLDVFGDPIRGLHAAGEIVGGLHGAGYYSGTALGKAAVFGLTAGRAAAAGRTGPAADAR